ncbi:MAG: FAD-dependent oxidoreductase [Candidatus Zixiibacteriota bacterium]
MEIKIGTFICEGCEIAKSIDLAKLVEIAKGDKQVGVCQTHGALCSPAGQDMIHAAMAEGQLNRAVVAACSERVFPEEFNFGRDVLVDRVCLRERVVWCHPPQDEDTQMLAEDAIRMGLAKVRTSQPPEPFIAETSKDIMVIGGGTTGMTAAKSAAAAGYNVTLVEKEAELGGWARKFVKVFPKKPPYQDLEDPGWDALVRAVESDPKITVHKSTVVEKTSGQPGQFEVDLRNGSRSTHLRVGAIILAAGWKPYDREKLTRWGFGVSPDVITNVDFEAMMASGEIRRPSDGKSPASVAFIQCAGSRDPDHLPYCSAVCCRVSLKQAKYIRNRLPGTNVFIVYKDLRSPAQYERFYAWAQDDDGVFLTKGELAAVVKEPDGSVSLDVGETLLGENIRIQADLVVLATGMVPATKVEPDSDAGAAETASTAAPEGETGTVAPAEGVTADGKKEAESAEKGARILNLTYRQGTDLPTLKYGFPDSHFICFPYETRRTGIYAAGAVRAPMDLDAAGNDADGAALKAIQVVEAIARGEAVHPRAGDQTYPEFLMQRCTQCKRCTEECPFGTLDEDNKGTPLPNPLRCRRCGICMGSCPERIISFKNYNVNMMSEMIKSIHVPDEFEEKPRILCFICENDALPALDMAGIKRLQYNAMIRFVPLRCLGSMNTIWVNDALAGGFDGVLLLGCKKGDDYQCHFVRGSELADYRVGNVREKLKQLVLEEERVQLNEVSMSDCDQLPAILDEFLEKIETIGPNPYKGM